MTTPLGFSLPVMVIGVLTAMLLAQVSILSIRDRGARWLLLLAIPPVAALFFTQVFFKKHPPAFYMAAKPLAPGIQISPIEWAGWWYLYQASILGALTAARRPRWVMFWIAGIAAAICLGVEEMGASVGFWRWHVVPPGDPNYGNPALDQMTGWVPFPMIHGLFGWVGVRAAPIAMLFFAFVTLIRTRRLLRFGQHMGLASVSVAAIIAAGNFQLAALAAPVLLAAWWLHGRLLERDLGPQWAALAPRRGWSTAASLSVVAAVCLGLLAANGYASRSLLVLPLAAATMAVACRVVRPIDGRRNLR